MMSLKLIALTSCITLAIIVHTYAQIAPGSNSYLPPAKDGYNYPSPTVPFPASKPPPGRPAPPAPGRNPAPANRPPGPPARPRGEPGPNDVHEPGMPFDFQYAVQDAETANDYSHNAKSDGDVTTGEYRVALPDGRTQVVKYTADWKTGYHAEVSYEGEAQFPQGPPAGGAGGRNQGGGGGAGYNY